MMVFKRKQIVILSLILMILVAGYLQYSYKKSSVAADSTDVGKIGDSVYVDNEDQASTDQTKNSTDTKDNNDSKKNKSDSKTKTTNASSPSAKAKNYFAQAKLDRETARGRDLDALKAISEDKNADSATKKNAYDQMIKMSLNSEREVKLETLIKQKGFSDAIAIFGEDGSLDIVVEAPTLTASQVAQITDIASRQMNVKISDIRVKNIY